MNVSLSSQPIEFVPWRAEYGQVFQPAHGYAFGSATGLNDKHYPWLVPPFVLGAATDGTRGFFIQRKDLESFFKMHLAVPVIMHGAALQLDVFQQLLPCLDIYQLVENNLVWDTQLLHRLLALGTTGEVDSHFLEFDLAHCAQEYLGLNLPKVINDSNGKNVQQNYHQWLNKEPQEIEAIYLEYLAKKVITAEWIYSELAKRLHKVLDTSVNAFGFVNKPWLLEQMARWGPQTHHIQLKASIVMRAITKNGLHLDAVKKEEIQKHLQEKLQGLHEQLRNQGYIAGDTGSSKALQGALKRLERLEHLQLPRTSQGLYATSREALQVFADTVPFIRLLLEYKETDTLLHVFRNKTRRVLHPSFNVLVKTGRTSSSGEINAQGIPKDKQIRSCFIPSSGKVFIDCDYKTIELVTLAQAILKQFKRPSRLASAINQGKDLHTMMAAQVLQIPETEVSEEDRNKAKAINFGKPGGMGDKALLKYAESTWNARFTSDEVKSWSAKWHAMLPEMQEFLKNDIDLGYKIAEVFDLTNAAYYYFAQEFWNDIADNWNSYEPNSSQGWMFLEVLKEAKPKNLGVPYTDQEIDYFWSRLASKRHLLNSDVRQMIQNRVPSPQLYHEVRKLSEKADVFTLTGRLRAKATFTERRNNIFQGLAADGAKLALWLLWRQGYRIVNFVHDQVLIEVPINEDYGTHVEKVKGLLIAGMKMVVADVNVDIKHDDTVRQHWA